MVSDAGRQEIASFGGELMASGFATQESIIGCDTTEIARVYAVAPVGFPVPDEYHAFLERMGKKAGTLFRGTDLFFPQMLDSGDVAVEISGEGLSLDDRFFFGDHQGYKVYFFKRGSEAVYTYQEGDPEETKLADGFVAFLRQSWNVQRKLRESTTAMRDQSKRH